MGKNLAYSSRIARSMKALWTNKKTFFTTIFVPNSIFRSLEAMLKRMVNVPNDFARDARQNFGKKYTNT
jgi:hypothetical protein